MLGWDMLGLLLGSLLNTPKRVSKQAHAVQKRLTDLFARLLFVPLASITGHATAILSVELGNHLFLAPVFQNSKSLS